MSETVLNHRLEGQGRRVVILHPVGLDLTFFDPIAADLSRDHQVLRVDLRGHGGSMDWPPAGSLDDYVADVHRLIAALDFAPSAVVGGSFGGMIAQLLALDHPGDVDALVLAACPCRIPPEGRTAMEERARAAEEGGMQAVLEPTLARWFTEAFRARDGDAATRERLLKNDPAGWAAAWRAIATLDVADRLAAIDVPTLCIAGEHDGASPPEVLRGIADRIPGAGYTVLQDAAHMVMIEQPDAFATLVRDFLRDA